MSRYGVLKTRLGLLWAKRSGVGRQALGVGEGVVRANRELPIANCASGASMAVVGGEVLGFGWLGAMFQVGQ